MSNTNVLWDSMKDENNLTYTENGDKAYKTMLNPLLDFLFKSGTMREAEEIDIVKSFLLAFQENPVYATRLAFYTRDIRGGQGERRVFRTCMKALANLHTETFLQVLNFIPEYGRWDDLFEIYRDTNHNTVKSAILTFIETQLGADLKNYEEKQSISLLAKWLPSENASADDTIKMAKVIRKHMGLTPKEYRKTLSALRAYLKVIEVNMSAKEWNQINYNQVPSKAMMKYRKAFNRNDAERYQSYLNELTNPENTTVKVNASTLYPFDIVKNAGGGFGYRQVSNEEIKLLDAQWKALPDYFNGKFDNALVVADTSGSMEGDPINVAIGLALYLAERNKGMFNNKFITFSSRPELQEIVGQHIVEKIRNLSKADWEMNTDIDAVFNLIYKAAINNTVDATDMPSMLYIISDMQFDSCTNHGEDVTVFEKWQNIFEKAGYKLPTVVFWNVSDYGNHCVPITVKNTGAIVCSGYSPAVIKYIMESDTTDTMQLVENIVNGERYNGILA